MSGSVRVSLGMPVFMAEAYLPETLENLLAQEFTDFELLISDNASTDATPDICADFARRDERVRYVRNSENKGAAHNYNQVFHLTTGTYFKWASYDDLLAPDYLTRCVDVLDSAPLSVALCYPRTWIIDADGDIVREHDDHFDIRAESPVERLRLFTWKWSWCNPCFGLHRRTVLARTRLIQPYISSDVTLLAELALLGEFWEIPERLFYRRVHSTSSRQGDVTLDQVAAWFEPSGKAGKLHPRHRIFAEIHRSIGRTNLSIADRVRCHSTFALSWAHRRSLVAGGRAKAELVARFGRAR